MFFLQIKDWERHQTPVKVERRKDYIALYTDLLYDPDFLCLPPSVQVLLIKCWLLRGRTGKNIPFDSGYLSQALGSPVNADDLQFLVDDRWMTVVDSKHPPKPKAMGHTKDYGKAGYSADFEDWWKVYPKRRNKADAFRAWMQTVEIRPPQEDLLRRTAAYAKANKSTEEKFIKFPGGWLRDRRWEDELEFPKRESKMAKANKIMDREQVEHFAHPKWKFYVTAVLAGDCPAGFEEYLRGVDADYILEAGDE